MRKKLFVLFPAVLLLFILSGCGSATWDEWEKWKTKVGNPVMAVSASDLSLNGFWDVVINGTSITRVEFSQPISKDGQLGMNHLEVPEGIWQIQILAKNCQPIPIKYQGFAGDTAFCKSTEKYINLTVDKQGPEIDVQAEAKDQYLLVEVSVLDISEVSVSVFGTTETTTSIRPAELEIPWDQVTKRTFRIKAIDAYGHEAINSPTITVPLPPNRWEKDAGWGQLALSAVPPCILGWCGTNKWVQYEDGELVGSASTNPLWWGALVSLVAFPATLLFFRVIFPILSVLKAFTGFSITLRNALKENEQALALPKPSVQLLGPGTSLEALIPARNVLSFLARLAQTNPEMATKIQAQLEEGGTNHE